MFKVTVVAATIVAATLLVVGAANVASARGPSPATLTTAGWACFNVPGLGVHCQPPGSDASSATISFLYFFDTTDPGDTDADLTGTETLIRADLYHGQPCPQEGLDQWTGLDLFGGPDVDYYACHHK